MNTVTVSGFGWQNSRETTGASTNAYGITRWLKEAECWLILEEEQVDSSLVAYFSKKVPETENLCFSPPFVVCRTASKNPADLKLVVLVGLALYYLRPICDQSPGYKACRLETISWRHGLFLQHWNGLSALLHSSLILLAWLCYGHCSELCRKNGEKPASITRSFKLSPAKAKLGLHQGSSFKHLPYTPLLCWSLPRCCPNTPFIVKMF